jgi:HK97 family phage prohead protease
MKQLNTESTVVFQEREDAAGDIVGSGHGMAVPYGTETMIGGVRESFSPGSFDISNVIGKPLAYRHGEPVGIITGAENREDGLYIDFDIVDTSLGRDAAVLARTNTIRGLSVGFNPVKSIMSKARDAIQHTAANLLEVSLTPYPAYVDAGVSRIRETEPEIEIGDTTMSETIDSTEIVSVDNEAREAVKNLREEMGTIHARVFTSESNEHPLAKYRSFGEYSKAVAAGEVESRALVDQITSNNLGVMPPNWQLEVRGIIDLGRRVIQGVGGPESAGTAGMDINWPYFDGNLNTIVESQANQKGEVNSVRIDLEKGTATLATYAAGSDISYQLLERSSPSYLDAHNRIMLASYASVTDRKFTADLWDDGTGLQDYDFAADTTGAAFREAIFEASVTCEDATGVPASAVFVSTAVFVAIGGWSTFQPEPYTVQNVSGVATASTLRVNVSGLPVIRAKYLDTNAAYNAIVTNGQAARWLEDGPRLATAENVAQLGRDISIYGYGTTAAYLPAGIVRVTNV